MIETSAEIVKLVEAGLSIIPVDLERKPKVKWRGDFPALNPIQLFDLSDKYNTVNWAIVLGQKSGGLICIDVDVKYYRGFETVLFKDLREYYPEILDKVWIEKTPSGGFHLMYRVDKEVGNMKVASREATDDELKTNPKEKWKCFLEIKGEGGLSHCFPSPRYVRVSGSLVKLDVEEHESLMTLLETYNEKFEVEKPVSLAKADADFYSVSPWEMFDASEEGAKLLEDEGWNVSKVQRKGGVYYSRPDAKSGTRGVCGGFDYKRRLYQIFTSSTQLDVKAYSPSNLLSELKFGGKKKEAFAWLVSKGYGKIKEHVEKNIIQKAARNRKPIPANISKEGREELEKLREAADSVHPFGIFWVETDFGWKINKELAIIVATQMGFCLYNDFVCFKEEHFIERIDETDFFNRFKSYIKEEPEVLVEILDAYETFLQKSGRFFISRLPQVDRRLLLKSTKDVSYKAYRNGYVVVTAEGIELRRYENLDLLLWKNQMQNRDFMEWDYDDSLYFKYLQKCCGISDHLFQCIGYYAHDYKSTATSYIVVLCEMVEDARKGGGSGKNVFTNLLGFTTSLLNKPGKNVKFDDTMLRTWKGQRILSLNDLDKKFDFLGLKELSSGEGEVGKKFVQEVTIDNEDMPKFICNTNFSFDPSGPGLKRRLIPLEFTDFFSVVGGVDVYFKRNFPSDRKSQDEWDAAEWIGYDNLIMKSIQKYIQNDCKLNVPNLTETGWIKQFEEKYFNLTHNFIRENMEEWLRLGTVIISKKFNPDYDLFCAENKVHKNFILNSHRMNEALGVYCDHYGIEFTKYKNVRTDSGEQQNAKIFERKTSNSEKTHTFTEVDPNLPF